MLSIVFAVIMTIAAIFCLASAMFGEDKDHSPNIVFAARVILVIISAVLAYGAYILS